MTVSEEEKREAVPGFANRRDWCGSACFHQCPVLSRSWHESAQTYARVAEALKDFDPQAGQVITLAAAGSLGRMEVLQHSDCDLIVIVPDDLTPDSDAAHNIMYAVWERLEPLNLRLPKSWGIFIEPASIAGLTRPEDLGHLGDSRSNFGKRLQCLLDSQPLFRPERFRELQQRILEWYATAFVESGYAKQWTYLLNDLIRYYRSYAAWQQFELKIEHDDSWYIRNAKLRTSRLIMYAGMLLLLGESSRHQPRDKVAWLLERLGMTPLERVIWCMEQYGDTDDDIIKLLECYEIFMAGMNDETIRAALIDHAPRTLDDLPPETIPEYGPIRNSSAEIMDILTRFVLARRNDWHPNFMRYLLF